MERKEPLQEKGAENGDAPSIDPKRVPLWCSCRVALALVSCFGFINLYALRVNLSVGMVCMINQTALDEANPPVTDNNTELPPGTQCRPDSSNSTSTDGEFTWDKETQGIILGSFFWGYLLTQIPGGWLSERFGGKAVYGWFMFMTAVATLLTPVGSRASPWLLVTLRIIQGLGEGVVFPAMHCMWANWAPPLERSKLISFSYAGAQIGNVITLPISGLLCDYGFDGGWGSIFYIFGALGVLWFIWWMLAAYNEPRGHPRISDIERDYIETSIGATKEMENHRKKLGTPWKKIFTSKPVWAIVVAHTFANWGTYTLLTNIPTYMSEVLKFNIRENGLYSAIPYIMFWIFINIGGYIADTLRSRGWRTVVVRKMMYTIGSIVPGLFLIGVGFINCDQPEIAIVLLSLGVGFCGFQYPGCMVNHVDIAPPFAGTLFGVSNTAATLPGILAPYAIGVITTDQTQSQWQTVFFISAAIYTAGAIFFLIFAEGEIQDWVRPYMFDEETMTIKEKIAEDKVPPVYDNAKSSIVEPVKNKNDFYNPGTVNPGYQGSEQTQL